MLIPLGHERMSARRWPIITFAFIAINVAAFLTTHSTIQEQAAALARTKAHILMLAGFHPELNMTPEVQAFIENVKKTEPGLWRRAQDQNRPLEDEWDVRMRMMDVDGATEPLQAEMDQLAVQYSAQVAASLTENYAFVPAQPKLITYVTANFLHGGWLHLIGNMWFLWLAGFVLEDIWGRPVYGVFYLLAGAAALQIHAWISGSMLVPTLGASGAVAALMGAFLVRFPTTKINMAWFYILFFKPRFYRFQMRAYWLLPLWLLMEIVYGMWFGQMTGVAHWAHVGGFVFGAVVALGIKVSGLEHKMDTAIESEVTLASDPEISQASDLFSRNQYDDAISVLKNYLVGRPDSLEAWMLLQQALWRKGNVAEFLTAAVKCCELHVKARHLDAALETYDEFLNAGGQRNQVPAATWLELCRAAENQGAYDRALAEYEQLAAACPAERQGLLAQLAAAKLCTKRLGRPQEALKLYEAAARSTMPHLDMEPAIDAGIREAKAALAGTGQVAIAGA